MICSIPSLGHSIHHAVWRSVRRQGIAFKNATSLSQYPLPIARLVSGKEDVWHLCKLVYVNRYDRLWIRQRPHVPFAISFSLSFSSRNRLRFSSSALIIISLIPCFSTYKLPSKFITENQWDMPLISVSYTPNNRLRDQQSQLGIGRSCSWCDIP